MLYRRIAFYATLTTGLLMVFIGLRFLISPVVAEAAYGIHVPTNNDFSFHYIKGIRDLFSGLILIFLLLLKEFRALGVILLTSVIIPSLDFMNVLAAPGHATASLYPHLTAIVLVLILGIYYIRHAKRLLS
jgi:hypothetical protein